MLVQCYTYLGILTSHINVLHSHPSTLVLHFWISGLNDTSIPQLCFISFSGSFFLSWIIKFSFELLKGIVIMIYLMPIFTFLCLAILPHSLYLSAKVLFHLADKNEDHFCSALSFKLKAYKVLIAPIWLKIPN